MFKAPRGTADILPAEQSYWRFVETKAAAICDLYGYRRLDTPVFEDYNLFVRSVGEGTDIVTKEMYTFEDRSGHLMALRPEGTAPVCRAYLQHGMHNLPQPVKLYYIAAIFRYERPQAGRYRQHHQFGCEAIGDADPAVDAEVIDLLWQFYKSLGLKGLSLHLNSIGCRVCRPSYIQELRNYYSGILEQLCPDCRSRFEKNPLRLLDCKEPACQAAADAAPSTLQSLCQECGQHHASLQNYLLRLDIDFKLDHRLVRGLDYYTRTVFEVQTREAGAQTALGGGGRYDNLIEDLGGRPTPAVGFGTGIERIIQNLISQKSPVPPPTNPTVYVAFAGEPARNTAFSVATDLRRSGISTVVALSSRSLKAQLKQADALQARYAVIIGEEELARSTVTLRDMGTGEQTTVPLSELTTRLTAS
ncbi:MAG: histidine--tRNA ligase [Dehalococcoidia bacterium]|nr:histidine--tRNA ligase [Dehalococcoidia bacterium]